MSEVLPTPSNIVVKLSSIEDGKIAGDTLEWAIDWEFNPLSNYTYPVTSVASSTTAFNIRNNSLTNVLTVDSKNNTVNIVSDVNITQNVSFDDIPDLTTANSLLSLAVGNAADILDVGIYGKYIFGVTSYSGLFRDASDSRFKLSVTTTAPNLTMDSSTLTNLDVAGLTATGLISATTLSGTISTVSQPNITTLSGLTTISSAVAGVLRAVSGVLSSSTTDNLTEGVSNLYYSDTRQRSAVSAGSKISYNSSSGTISLDVSSGFTLGNATLSNLTASRLVASDGSKLTASTNLSSWIVGTTNQVTVSDNGSGGVTLSTPQSIHTSATPQFSSMGLGTTAGSAGTLTLAGSTSGTITLSAGATPTSYTFTLPSTSGTANYLLSTDGSGNTSWSYPSYSGFQVYTRRRTGHASDSGSTANTWVTRILDTNVAGNLDGSITSLSSNQVTIQAGTYLLYAHGGCYANGSTATHLIRIYNQTDGSTVVEGTSENASSTVTMSRSFAYAYITIASAKVFTVDHQTSVNASFGPTTAGSMTNTTDNYCMFVISKVV